MEEKNVTILIASPPFRNLNGYEALRASIGLIDHEVKIIWVQDGVYSALQATKNKMSTPIMTLAEDMGIELYVDEKDLQDRNLQDQELADVVEAMPHEAVLANMHEADIVITF